MRHTIFGGAVSRISVVAGDEIRVETGVLWLTFEARDVVLRGGQSFMAPRGGEVMAQSLGGAARFRLWRAGKTAQTARRFEPRNWRRVWFWRALHPLG